MSSRCLQLALALALAAGAALARAQTATLPGTTETQALQTLLKLFNDPATQPAALDAEIDSFREHFPESKKMASVLVLAVRYHDEHGEYLPELRYGTALLALAPHDLYVLSRLGQAIPQNVRNSDLNRDQMLTQAETYDNEVLEGLKEFQISAAGMDFQGVHYTQQRATLLRNNLAGPAYASLGRIAALRGQFAASAAAFTSALPFEPDPNQQALTYYHIALAAFAAHQVVQAKAALAKAEALKPQSQILRNLIEAEQARLDKGSGN